MRYIYSVKLKLLVIGPRVSDTLGKLSKPLTYSLISLWFAISPFPSAVSCVSPLAVSISSHSSAFCVCDRAILVKGPHSDRPGESHVEVFRALTCAMRRYPGVYGRFFLLFNSNFT